LVRQIEKNPHGQGQVRKFLDFFEKMPLPKMSRGRSRIN